MTPSVSSPPEDSIGARLHLGARPLVGGGGGGGGGGWCRNRGRERGLWQHGRWQRHGRRRWCWRRRGSSWRRRYGPCGWRWCSGWRRRFWRRGRSGRPLERRRHREGEPSSVVSRVNVDNVSVAESDGLILSHLLGRSGAGAPYAAHTAADSCRQQRDVRKLEQKLLARDGCSL